MSEKPKNPLFPQGCYSIQYRPNQLVPGVDHFDGTLRVTRLDDKIRVSADLYGHRTGSLADAGDYACGSVAPPPGGRLSLPVFPRSTYRFYLQVGRVDENAPGPGKIHFQVEVHEFDQATKRFGNLGSRTLILSWSPEEDEGSKKALARRNGYKASEAEAAARGFTGNILDEEAVNIVGTVSLRRLDDRYVREAVVEIDAVDGAPLPLGSRPVYFQSPKEGEPPTPGKVDWKRAFEGCDWKVEAKPSNRDRQGGTVHGKAIRPWQDAELHKEMSATRDDSEPQLDKEWRYHLLCVGTFANPQYERGVLYDVGGSDLNQNPREGAAIAADWIIPQDWRDQWPAFQRLAKFSEAEGLYFRTAVHEIGHAMGLDHDAKGTHFMSTTDTIESVARGIYRAAIQAQADAAREASLAKANVTLLEQVGPLKAGASAANDRSSALLVFVNKAKAEAAKGSEAEKAAKQARFPDNVDWTFSDRDKDLLRHAPDVFVRPGTFAENLESIEGLRDEAPSPAPGFTLELIPLLESVPFGAPVRVKLKLTNTSNQPQKAPASLNLKTGYVSGTVTDPSGANVLPFYPVILSDDKDGLKELEPDESLYHSVTLLRGHQGALFRMEGVHRVEAEVGWYLDGKKVRVRGSTDVRVEAPVDPAHRIAALNLISTPEAFLSLALGADHLPEGNTAVQACLNVPVLRPHFAVVQIKWRLNEGTPGRVNEAYQALLGPAMLSVSEVNRLIQLFTPFKGKYKLPTDPTKDLADQAIAELTKKATELKKNERFSEG
jgi:hypothetical protein